jgi:hypothetical protein
MEGLTITIMSLLLKICFHLSLTTGCREEQRTLFTQDSAKDSNATGTTPAISLAAAASAAVSKACNKTFGPQLRF